MKKLYVLSCSCLLVRVLLAADYTWTPTSALWLTDPNWNNGAAWSDGNTAIFSGNAPTAVSVSGEANAYDVKVSGADYSFSGGGTIVISNGYFDVANGATATVPCALSQPNATPGTANRFRKSGTGTLVLKGNGSFDRYLHVAGDMIVDGGTFRITSSLSGSATDNMPFILANGGKFIVDGGGKVYVKGGYSMNSGVDVAVTNGLLDFTGLSGEFMSSYYPGISDNRIGSVTKGTRSVLTVQDKGIVSGGTFRVSQGGSNPGIVNLNPGGIMALSKFSNDNGNSVGAINFNGGSLVRRSGVTGVLFSYSGTDSEAKWRKVSVNIMEGGLHFTDGGKDTIINRPLLNGTGGADGGVHVTGLGSDHIISITNVNTYTGGTSISNVGTVAILSDSSLGAVPSVPTVNFTFRGGSCYLASAADAGTVDVNANRLIEVAEGASAQFKAYTNSTLVLNNAISALGGGINVLGNNTTVSGTVAFNPGAGATNQALRLYSYGGVADFRSGVTHLTNLVKATGTDASIYARGNGSGWSSNYVLRISGGEVVTDGGYAITYDYGQIEVTNAFLNIAKCAEVLNGHGKPGRISILNGGVVEAPAFRFSQCSYADAEVYLGTGSELRVTYLKIDTGMKNPYRGIFYFDGGKIVSRVTSASFFGDGSDYYTNIHVRVMKGGAKFDTNGYVARVHKALEGDENGSGGLVKYGGGHLLLHQPCTYTGATEIVEGTLRLSGPTNILWPGSTLILGTNGVCEARTDYIGTTHLGSDSWIDCTQTLARVEGCGRITASSHVSVTNSIAPGLGEGGVGTLKFDRACNLRGTLEIDVNEGGADCLELENGTQDLTNLSLKVNVSDTFNPPRGSKYTIVSAPAGITGAFAGVDFGSSRSSRWTLYRRGNSIVLCYVRGIKIILK